MENEISNINNIGLTFTLLMSMMLLLLPRKLAIVPIIATACYISLGQVIVIEGFHFYMIRILILAGWVRLIFRKEMTLNTFNIMDKVFILWVVSNVVIYTISRGTSQDLINRLGFAYDAVGLYVLFRFLIRDEQDMKIAIKAIAVVILPLAISMLIENMAGKNWFSIFGGVAEFSQVREGKIRCQGPFGHPILAGTFGATLLPLFIGLWVIERPKRITSAIGIVSATIITMSSHSSGPLMSWVYGIVALSLFPMRQKMRAIRWSIFLGLGALHMVMKAPVWFLIARISDLIGGGGWHRSELINQAINHFDEWWLLGTDYTAHWMPNVLPAYPTMVDITNQFVVEGIHGGLITLALFIMIIVLGFKAVGSTIRKLEDNSHATKFFIWSLGSALFAHVMSFLGVSYFDQIKDFWYLLLAMMANYSARTWTEKVEKK